MEELNEHLKERAEQLIEQNDQLRKKSEQLQEKVYLLSEADEISDLLEGRYTTVFRIILIIFCHQNCILQIRGLRTRTRCCY